MTYEIRLARRAASDVTRLDRRTAERILRRLDEIAADPFGPYSKPLTNSGGKRSSRIGDFRRVYAVDLEARIVDVSAIAPRGEVYRDL